MPCDSWQYSSYLTFYGIMVDTNFDGSTFTISWKVSKIICKSNYYVFGKPIRKHKYGHPPTTSLFWSFEWNITLYLYSLNMNTLHQEPNMAKHFSLLCVMVWVWMSYIYVFMFNCYWTKKCFRIDYCFFVNCIYECYGY